MPFIAFEKVRDKNWKDAYLYNERHKQNGTLINVIFSSFSELYLERISLGAINEQTITIYYHTDALTDIPANFYHLSELSSTLETISID